MPIFRILRPDTMQRYLMDEGMASDTLIAFGDAVKFLDDDETRVGGYLVRFTTERDPDAVGDFFTADTDFGVAVDGMKLGLHYEHGMDPQIGKARIGEGQIQRKDAGLWYEAQVEISEEYRAAIRKLIKDGRLGYSSGAVAHLVEREPMGAAHHIKRWPLGESSLTPRPAEYRNIVELKSLGLLKHEDIPAKAAPDSAAPVSADVVPADKPEPTTAEPIPAMENEKQEPEVEAKADTTRVPIFTMDDVRAEVEAKMKAFADSQRTVKASGPVILTTGTGDTGYKAMDHWLRTGDVGAVKSVQSGPNQIDIDLAAAKAWKASNDTDMNVGTAADGGSLVTDDMANQIVARRDESMLANQLGVRRFTGTGTTLDVPVDNEADGEFVSTAEAGTFDRDAPALTQTVLTLVKYTKRIQVSYELIQDTATNLFDFLGDFIGRGLAKTHNNLLATEIKANGGEIELLGTATLSLGDLENAAFGNDIAMYLDDSGSVAWVMKPATYAAILAIGGTSNRYYNVDTGVGDVSNRMRPTILGMPVYFTQKADAYGNGQPIFFGNWNYLGLYESPTLQVLRDPYSSASAGQVNFHYYFRADYGVLHSEAVGFLRHINT